MDKGVVNESIRLGHSTEIYSRYTTTEDINIVRVKRKGCEV